MAKKPHPPKLQAWIEARKRFHLSHLHVQMARELGLNPRKFGGLGSNPHERWKSPLPEFIEDIYEKRFGRTRPEVVLTIEQVAEAMERKKEAPPAPTRAEPGALEGPDK
jgi:hypothetical protein